MKNSSKNTSIAWFSNDLRVHDNPMLSAAHNSGNQVLHVFFKADAYHSLQPGTMADPSANRRRYLELTLASLSQALAQKGQLLHVFEGSAVQELPVLLNKHNISTIYRSRPFSANECLLWRTICAGTSGIKKSVHDGASLYRLDQLPVELAKLPKQFTPFRKLMESSGLQIDPAAKGIDGHSSVPAATGQLAPMDSRKTPVPVGEHQALAYLKTYISAGTLFDYQHTRNQLEQGSSLLSACLAMGSLSVRELFRKISGAIGDGLENEAVYAYYFELLWREFFLWNSLRIDKKLFYKGGERAKNLTTSFYPQRLRAWQTGTTEWPLVNAIMHELNDSGYISNRSRQIAASCLINELQLDWRYGADYFERQLIDYDPALNWGNWQYIAGVGADPRGGRHFNLVKQSQQYDPDRAYIRKWYGEQQLTPTQCLDSHY